MREGPESLRAVPMSLREDEEVGGVVWGVPAVEEFELRRRNRDTGGADESGSPFS